MTTTISVKAHVGSQFSQVTVPIPTLKYLNNFIRLNKSAKDILDIGVFPDAKEITESFAAHDAVTHKLGLSYEFLKKINPLILVAGDGSTPRTGVTFAFKTKFNVVSIDPNNNEKDYSSVRRLLVLKKRLGDPEFLDLLENDPYPPFIDWENGGYSRRPIILVGVHSHIPEDELIAFHKVVGKALFAVVEIPCCYPQQYLKAFGKPTIEYIDWGIHSEKRTVRIWKFRKDE
jgi:hypothetical protein